MKQSAEAKLMLLAKKKRSNKKNIKKKKKKRESGQPRRRREEKHTKKNLNFYLINYFNIFNDMWHLVIVHMGAMSQLTGDLTVWLTDVWHCPKIYTLGMTLGQKKLYVLNVENHETWG